MTQTRRDLGLWRLTHLCVGSRGMFVQLTLIWETHYHCIEIWEREVKCMVKWSLKMLLHEVATLNWGKCHENFFPPVFRTKFNYIFKKVCIYVFYPPSGHIAEQKGVVLYIYLNFSFLFSSICYNLQQMHYYFLFFVPYMYFLSVFVVSSQ